MPNYVYHKLVFDADQLQNAVKNVIDEDNEVNFHKLVPMPPNLYHGSLGPEEEKDFELNWYNWCVDNWGTKWNACESSFGVDEIDGKLSGWIQFETAWSVAYPWIAAFINDKQIPFDLYYMDEADLFWGHEKYGPNKFGMSGARIERTYKRRDDQTDYPKICKTFRGVESLADEGDEGD